MLPNSILYLIFRFKGNLNLKWRRGRDSNPCGVAPKRFSRPPRYDHFDTSPYKTSRPNRRTPSGLIQRLKILTQNKHNVNTFLRKIVALNVCNELLPKTVVFRTVRDVGPNFQATKPNAGKVFMLSAGYARLGRTDLLRLCQST